MTWDEFIALVNQRATDIHEYQGRLLGKYDKFNPIENKMIADDVEKYIDMTVMSLSLEYHDSFVSLRRERIEGDIEYNKYCITAHRASRGLLAWPIFEVEWLVKGLLGIALARQAVVIHNEPNGDKILKNRVIRFLG